MEKFAYLIGDIFFLFPVWLLVYIYRKDLRRQITTTGFVFGLIALITGPLFMRDYWHPYLLFNLPIGIEDFLFGFFSAGIASVLYEELYGKLFAIRKDRRLNWILITLIGIFLSLFTLIIVSFKFSINSIHITEMLLVAWIVVIIAFRRDLLIDMIMSGIFFGVFYFLVFFAFLSLFPNIVSSLWEVRNMSGMLVAGIPLEELMWAFTFGCVAGPFYEFATGRKIK